MWNGKRPNRFIGVLLVVGFLGSTLRGRLSDSYISTRDAWMFYFIPLGVQRSSLSEGDESDGRGKSWRNMVRLLHRWTRCGVLTERVLFACHSVLSREAYDGRRGASCEYGRYMLINSAATSADCGQLMTCVITRVIRTCVRLYLPVLEPSKPVDADTEIGN